VPVAPNQAQAERWGGAGGAFWVEHEAGYDRQLGGYGAAMLAAADLTDRDAVLDAGCGTGTTALQAGGRAARVLGIDLSPVMIARARERAAAAANVRFEVADAQTAPLDHHDVVISRFGLMFFDDPPAAFTNLRAAAGAAGRLATVCWQGLERNDWMGVPGAAMRRVVPVGDLGEPGQPGPFSLASRDRLAALLPRSRQLDPAADEIGGRAAVGGRGYRWCLRISDGVRQHGRTWCCAYQNRDNPGQSDRCREHFCRRDSFDLHVVEVDVPLVDGRQVGIAAPVGLVHTDLEVGTSPIAVSRGHLLLVDAVSIT